MKLFFKSIPLFAVLLIFSNTLKTNAQTLAGGNTFSVAVCTSGIVDTWGSNGFGQLGIGDNNYYNFPVKVTDLSGVSSIASGEFHTIALMVDSTVWSWGRNIYGALGNGTDTTCDVPVMVNNLTGVVKVAAGGWHSLAIREDGTVWIWGQNNLGQIGNGFTGGFITDPVQVNNLSDVIAIAGGEESSFALKNDGTVWAWGRNDYGQLGIGINTGTNLPTQVANIRDNCHRRWFISYSRCEERWHFVDLGQQCFWTTWKCKQCKSNIPVQITALSDVKAIAGGNYHSVALMNDSTVWAWGQGMQGQLGDGMNASSNFPVQVSGLSEVTAIASGMNHALALKNDNTIWSWGIGGAGELGQEIIVTVMFLCRLSVCVNFQHQ